MTETPLPLALRVQHLTYEYSDGFRALDDVSFALAAGERVGLVGPSGAGKSTLLLHLNGLLPNPLPAGHRENGSAAVSVNGLPISPGNLAGIRRDVGFLFQDPDDQLFCPTVAEDVAFGPLNLGLPTEDVKLRIAESLAAVGLTGYEHRSTMRLSVGERKRVCLAGLLACRPSILALDEPSSNLDPRARRRLLSHLGEFPGSQIIATHDLDFVVEHCQRVLVLDNGRIHADGTPSGVLAKPHLMEQHGLEVPLLLKVRQ
jgi:energy-coupling factor transporter ATP-binding protein EcfA2